MKIIIDVFFVFMVNTATAQNYQVADISCLFRAPGVDGNVEERLTARLRKPPTFSGHPIFADDRRINPMANPFCQIKHDPYEQSGLIYNLVVNDFKRCPTRRKDGYVTVRVWFPQLPGVMLAADEEVVIMCQPAMPTIIQNRAAGFAGSLPSHGHVSGVVEESPERLEYEVALFRETEARNGQSNSTVEQAVPIGSRLQLRARINTQSAWKYAKLIGVTVSSEQGNPMAPGHVELIKDGCRQPQFSSIVPTHPQRLEDQPGVVKLDFEAFMLDSELSGSSKLWIHATIKACIDALDCLPELCKDLFQPSGYGKKRRSIAGGRPPVYLEVSKDDSMSMAYIMENRRQTILGETPTTFAHERMGLSSRQDVTSPNPHLTSPSPIPRPQNISTPALSTTFKPSSASFPSRNLNDNVGVTVIMPDEFFNHAGLLHESCSRLLIACGMLATFVMSSSIFICYLTTKLRQLQTSLLQQQCSSSASLKAESIASSSKYPSVRYLLQ